MKGEKYHSASGSSSHENMAFTLCKKSLVLSAKLLFHFHLSTPLLLSFPTHSLVQDYLMQLESDVSGIIIQ